MHDATRVLLIALGVALVVVLLVPLLIMAGMMGGMMAGWGGWAVIGLAVVLLVVGGALIAVGLRRHR